MDIFYVKYIMLDGSLDKHGSRHDNETRIGGCPSKFISILTGNIRVDQVWIQV